LTTTLIADTMALSTLALFVAAIIIRRTFSSFVVAHRRGRVVALSTLSRQPLPAFANPVAGWLLFAFSIAIALVAVAHPPPLSPLLLPPSPSPSSLHATLEKPSSA
jgi:hypothetical protein